MNSQRCIVVLIFFGLAPLLAGCGKGTSAERLPLHGTVTLANGEKPSGTINFKPDKGLPGPVANTKLTEGSYKFDRSNGPTAGPQIVTVNRVFPRSDMLKSLADKKPGPKKSIGSKQPVPTTKTQWMLAVDLADDGEYSHDFKLEK